MTLVSRDVIDAFGQVLRTTLVDAAQPPQTIVLGWICYRRREDGAYVEVVHEREHRPSLAPPNRNLPYYDVK